MDKHKFLAIYSPDLFQAEQLNDDYIAKGHGKTKSFSNKLACYFNSIYCLSRNKKAKTEETRKEPKREIREPEGDICCYEEISEREKRKEQHCSKPRGIKPKTFLPCVTTTEPHELRDQGEPEPQSPREFL
eukprot:12734944-Ditylum_brightwellii.AAC.1